MCVEPGKMGLDIDPQTLGRPTEAVLFCRPHGDEVPPPGQERSQCLRLRVGNRAGCGANRLRNVRQGASSKGIGLGQLARGLRNIADLPGGDHHDGQGRCWQRGHHGALQPSGGFEHHQGWADPLSLRHEVRNAGGIVGNGPTCSSRA